MSTSLSLEDELSSATTYFFLRGVLLFTTTWVMLAGFLWGCWVSFFGVKVVTVGVKVGW